MPDEAAGELPRAYVVKSSSVGLEDNDRMVIRDIQRHVEQHKARHKWLKGGRSLTFLFEEAVTADLWRNIKESFSLRLSPSHPQGRSYGDC